MRRVILFSSLILMTGFASLVMAAYNGSVISAGSSSGAAQIEVSNVTLQVGLGGSVVTKNAQVVPDPTTWAINMHANKVMFGVKYLFVNQQLVLKRKFSVGLQVWSVAGDGTETKVFDNTRIVFPEVSANGKKDGTAWTSSLTMSTNNFKVKVFWDIYGKGGGNSTFECTLDKVLE